MSSWSDVCGASVAARVQLAGCLTLYEISGFPQVSGTQMLFKTCGTGGGGGGDFEMRRDTAFVQLEDNVGGSTGGFVATSYQQVYAVAQCEGDLSPGDCGQCVTQTVQNTEKPIIPVDLYRSIRETQLVGLSGYSKEGLPVFAIGVGLSTYDKASISEYRDRIILPLVTKKFGRPISTCIKVLDMTGLKLSALNQMKILTAISTVDDLNYPEKTEAYYIVNAPYIFSACWKVVKPLLQERTRKTVHVLHDCGRDELLKIMDHSSLPHFCRREGSGSSKNSSSDDCFSLDHPFHQELYHFIKEQALNQELIKQGSLHVNIPDQDPEDAKIVQVIEAEFHKLGEQNGSVNGGRKE